VERRNPFPHVLDATPIPDTAAEVDLSRLDVGDNEYGGPFLLNLRGKRLLVVGASGLASPPCCGTRSGRPGR